MSKIVRLDKSYDLFISYSWSSNNHGICGHTFEVIEYYLLLSSKYNVGIMLCEDITWETFKEAIIDKYDLSDQELQKMKNDTHFYNRPMIVMGTNILFTDGGVKNLSKVKLYFNNIFMFACGNKEIKDNDIDNIHILQDDRIYEPVKKNGIHYIKKILFSKFKKLNKSADRIMLYGSKNCRQISNDLYTELVNKYNKDFLLLVNDENKPSLPDNFKIEALPAKNLFEKFSTYVYTEVPRHFDCSPRFIAECKFYNKEVIYHNINYWEEDKGLFWRHHDVHNNFESLFLTKEDEIFNILKDYL